MRELTGKLALVTGGARGVGKAIALEFAARGAHVLVNYFHSHAEAKATKAEIEANGGKADLLRASVARQDQTERMFEEIRSRFGYLDVLVNNAASGALVPVAEVTDEMLDRAADTNLKGGLRCARLAAPLMAARGGGSIVTVSALGGSQMVMANYLACAPAKAAAEAVTRYLAVEFAPLNIRVNTASAAMLASEVADGFPDADDMQRVIRESTPLARLGTPEEFARVVAFLASDDSSWITGQVLLADGGLSLGASLLSPAQVDRPDDGDDIAVVGMGLVVSGADSPEEFWRLRLAGADLFVPVPEDRWERANFHSADLAAEDKGYQDNCVFITSGDPADRDELTTKWLRHSLVQALDGVATTETDRFSFLVGYTPDGSQHLEEAGVLAAALGLADRVLDDLERPDLLAAVTEALTDRYRRGAEDPSRFLPHRVGRNAMAGLLPADTEPLMVDTACSSSLYAVDIGVKGLQAGEQDIAVCGGAFALGPRGTVLFSKLQGLSTRGDVRALDADADGVIFADGAAVVVLKRLSRARSDGDRVLGVLTAFGSSSDGKGKAVYAPNADGQDLAVSRALAGSGGDEVDWVIAHATGTPAGDLAEFSTLRRHFGGTHQTAVTSNKSLIGHTGWAAGVVSLIEALLGLAHETIPPQHRFDRTPAEFRISETGLTVPTTARPWPREGRRPRSAAVSGFGFGGTNAHLVVREDLPGVRGTKIAPPTGRVVIVGASTHVPSTSDTFGEFYPVPPFGEVRLPPPTVRTIDRCQPMVLHCARELRDQLGGLWQHGAERAGVFVGHLGPTRSAMLYATRCYLDDIGATLAGVVPPEFLAAFDDEVRRLVPPSTEDAFPGMMPNVISARVANYFDLNGPTMTVDSGLSSTLSALDLASRYLRAGEVDFALVGGINGNVLQEYRALLGDLVGAEVDLAEGAFLFALTTEDHAAHFGLPVLGFLDQAAGREVDCGEHARYAGAAGGFALARLLAGPPGPVTLVCDQARLGLTVTDSAPAALPERFLDSAEFAPGEPIKVSRYVPRLRENPPRIVRDPLPFFVPGTAVLTDCPAGLVVPAGTVVLSTARLPEPRPGWFHLADLTPDAVRECLVAGPPIRHVRVVSDLGAVSPEAALHAGDDSVTRLHDLAFLVVQQRYDALESFVALVLGARPDGRDHPCLGLFSALVKCAHHELSKCLTFGLFTAERDMGAAVRLAERESAAQRLYPVVLRDADGARKTLVLVPERIELSEPTGAVLSADSVVLATGGARGITAEVMKELARTFRPRLYLLGSNPLETYPAQVFEGSDEEFALRRQDFIRTRLSVRPGVLVATLNREFDRMLDARAAHRNIAEMVEHCGPDRVTYLTCDVTDQAAVAAAVEPILRSHQRIDLVVNAAGRNRSALIRDKDFAEFRAIRDLKVNGYRNLKSALADRPPKIWCNFGSLLGFFGLAGELDYGSGNDFLASAAEHGAALSGTDEFTLGWTLWDGVGIGANELTRSYFKRGGSYTHMPIAEGLHHFVQELHTSSRHPFVLHMGESELELGRRLYPGYLESTMESQADGIEYEFDLAEVNHLEHHLVRGVPTLPATWVTQLAADAATRLVPGRQVIGFADLRFAHFVQARPGAPASPRRISATVLERGEEVTLVEVRITADVVSPGGILLVKDRLLSTATVRLAPRFPVAPTWRAWPDDEAEVDQPDPYHLPGSPVRLSGPFVATSRTRTHPNGKRARYAPPLETDDPRSTIPVILLDAMVRTEVLAPVDGGLLPVAVPVAIRRIDLYQRAGDHDLVAEHGALELYATPEDSTVGLPDARNRFVATTADGRVVAQVHDVEAIALGHVCPTTSAFQELAASAQSTVASV
jgi:NAD(P)-dependent dehydrogenase (short-subunit alcohol dehydrogenase family)/3-oxoacyl-(acyl-carrier-protein) synthase